MKNQISAEDQITQSSGQNQKSQAVQIPGKSKVNFWMILAFVFGFLFFLMVAVNLVKLRTASDVIPFPNTSISPAKPVGTNSFSGIVKTGAQLGEEKSHCASGLYLVADEGEELIAGTGTKVLLLRLPGGLDESPMLSDQKYVGKKVEVVGKYPAQENFCSALICQCEDFILVDYININGTESLEKRQTKIEGQIDCLPHRDTTRGQTTECAIGLRGKDGIYYRLLGLYQGDVISGKINPGQNVVITGIFTPSQDSKYNTIGTIEVVSIEYTN